jgi:hypothetical protein
VESGGSLSPPHAQRLAEQVRQVTEQLKQIAEQEPTKELFGPALGESLRPEKKQGIDDDTRQLESAGTPGEQRRAARALRQRLGEVSQAFDSSQPGVRSGRPASEPLETSGQEAISQGLRQLESAVRRRELGRGTQPDELRLRRSAARSLQNGLRGEYGHNERTDAVVRRLSEDLQEPEFAVDARTVQQLVQDIQHLRREVVAGDERKRGEAELEHLDASRYPPAYRRSIEKYFEQLSEQR